MLVNMDYAMKWVRKVPRETQPEWFGKDGISWHAIAYERMIEDENGWSVEVEVHVQVLDETTQQSSDSVFALVLASLELYKKAHPDVEEAIFKADNAGYYHCEETVVRLFSHRNAVDGIKILGLHFGEPGKGKSICDQYFAILKALVNRAIAAGKKANTAESFAIAMCHGDGVANTVILLGQIENVMEQKQKKKKKETFLSDISKHHEFLFLDGGIEARYLPGFGEGQLFEIDLDLMDTTNVPKFVYIIVNKDKLTEEFQCKNTSNPLPYREEGQKIHLDVKGGQGDIDNDSTTHNIESDEEDSDDEEYERVVYSCKRTPGCIKTFRRHSDYQTHMHSNVLLCLVPEEKQSSKHHLVARYIAINGISHKYQSKTYQETRSMIFCNELLPSIDPLFLNSGIKEELARGHAIVPAKKSLPFTTAQKEFLTKKFMIGVGLTKHKKKEGSRSCQGNAFGIQTE